MELRHFTAQTVPILDSAKTFLEMIPNHMRITFDSSILNDSFHRTCELHAECLLHRAKYFANFNDPREKYLDGQESS